MRCFVAIWPSADVVQALADLRRPTIAGLRWTTPDQWHVTLRFFGELSADEVTAATVALRLAAEPMTAPVSARGGPNTRLLGPGLVIWPVEGLEAAARELQRATAGIGEAVSERRYLGHLTIARGRRGLDLRSVHDLLAPLEMRWPVTLISLVRSELRPDRARYRTIEEIGLGDSPSGIP